MGNGSGACGTGTLGRMSPENRSYLPGVSAALQRETRILADDAAANRARN